MRLNKRQPLLVNDFHPVTLMQLMFFDLCSISACRTIRVHCVLNMPQFIRRPLFINHNLYNRKCNVDVMLSWNLDWFCWFNSVRVFFYYYLNRGCGSDRLYQPSVESRQLYLQRILCLKALTEVLNSKCKKYIMNETEENTWNTIENKYQKKMWQTWENI